MTKLTTTVDSVTSKISELNEEYDLLDKGKQAVGFAGDLSVKAIDKGMQVQGLRLLYKAGGKSGTYEAE